MFKAATGPIDPAIARPTLYGGHGGWRGTAVLNTAAPASNVGQTITLTGTNFGAGTEVLFQTRDNAGNLGTVAVAPNAISADGKSLQVVVPVLAATGDVKVVNIGSRNLGYSGYNDAIYRKVTLSFTPSATTATLNFTDDGLEGIDNESWGLDNVAVKQGATTVFCGRFRRRRQGQLEQRRGRHRRPGRVHQVLGPLQQRRAEPQPDRADRWQDDTVSFDLYVLDSWEGAVRTRAPTFQVSADGAVLMREAFENYPASGGTRPTTRAPRSSCRSSRR